jgi:predicted O-methyltransferase YrrM
MSELWAQVDDYVTRSIVRPDPALDQALATAAEAGMPPIAVSAPQGKMLQLFARMIGARRILEIGTLGGYSTIWLARSVPAGGQVISLELDPKHAAVARSSLARAGVADLVEIKVGPALETLPTLEGPFDLSFIDADKVNIPAYFDWAVKLGRPGGVIVVDNVVRNGRLVDAADSDQNVGGVRKLHELLSQDRRVKATTIQTVGSKGYDGFTLALIGDAGA